VTDELNEKLERVNSETPAWVVVLMFEGLEGEAAVAGSGKFADEIWKQWEKDFDWNKGPAGKEFADGLLLCFIRDTKSIEIRAGDNAAELLHADHAFVHQTIEETEEISNQEGGSSRSKHQRSYYASSVQFCAEAVLTKVGEGHGLTEPESSCVIL